MTEFAAVISLGSIRGATGFRIDTAQADDQGPFLLSSAGDVNGDGFDDVIIGERFADPNGESSGSTYVVFGRAGGFGASVALASLDGTTGFRLDGAATRDFSGWSVSSAGDVNGDGFDDVIVGARGADPNGTYSGSSYVVFGKPGGFSADIALSSLDRTSGFRIDGATPFDVAGASVSSAGDVNGDGFDDLIVGAYGADPNGDFSGSSYVVFGKAGGFASSIDLSSLDGTTGFRLDGVATRDFSGLSVSSAGDVNGDGFDDVIVGASGAAPSGPYSGSSYLVFGRSGGFAASIDLSSLDGTNGFRLDGVSDYDSSGRPVSSAGDVNGDGYDDLIVGAYGDDPGGKNNAGSSYVIFGKAGGFAGSIALSSLDGMTGFRLVGPEAYNYSGCSVSSAGDVNGDGFDDLIVGSRNADSNVQDSGSSYVVFGKAGGFASSIALSSLNGKNGFRLDGAAAFDQSGQEVSSAGDVNGDGFDDLIVGTDGSSYVIFGRAPDTEVTRTGTAIANTILGGAFADTLNGLGGDDALKGNAGSDVLEGGAGEDMLNGGRGRDRLEGGAGEDVLIGGRGIDTLAGGLNNDQYIVDDAGDRVVEADRSGVRDTVLATVDHTLEDFVERIKAFRTTDGLTLGGNELDNHLIGGVGDDTLTGEDGGDRYYVGAGDVVVEAADGGLDRVFASEDHTLSDNVEQLRAASGAPGLRLTGNAGDNLVVGGAGADTLSGAGGRDQLRGGEGDDVFRFAALSDSRPGRADVIRDFVPGADLIDLSALDAVAGGADDPFDFIGSDAFSGAAGELRYEAIGGYTRVEADVDGDGKANFRLVIERDVTLGEADFLL